MWKKPLSLALAGFLLGCALVACGGNAQAATLTQNFKADNARVFQIDHALSVEKLTDSRIAVTQINGSMQYFSDATGAVWSKVLLVVNPAGGNSPKWIAVSGTNRFIATTFQSEISCSGGQTVMGWATVGAAEYLADGCTLYNAVVSKAN